MGMPIGHGIKKALFLIPRADAVRLARAMGPSNRLSEEFKETRRLFPGQFCLSQPSSVSKTAKGVYRKRLDMLC